MGTLLKWKTCMKNVKCLIVVNNQKISGSMCTTLSLLYDIHELNKMHHLVVAECGCETILVGGIVNLVQIPKHIVQIFA